jgi:hypothetical protein
MSTTTMPTPIMVPKGRAIAVGLGAVIMASALTWTATTLSIDDTSAPASPAAEVTTDLSTRSRAAGVALAAPDLSTRTGAAAVAAVPPLEQAAAYGQDPLAAWIADPVMLAKVKAIVAVPVDQIAAAYGRDGVTHTNAATLIPLIGRS